MAYLNAINELDDNARYALMRACEWRSESFSLDITHSSQPHLQNVECLFLIFNIFDSLACQCNTIYLTSCGTGKVAPRSSRIFKIS